MGFIHRIAAVGSAAIIGAGAALVAVAPASAVAAGDWAGFASAFEGSATSIELSADVTGVQSATLPDGKTLVLDLNGHRLTVTGADGFAGLGVPANTTLVVTDTSGARSGVLTARGGQYGAGIGGHFRVASGTVSVLAGTVNATGGQYGAAIGGGKDRGSGPITISGGTVIANAGNYAAGLGSSDDATTGDILISGGTVTARGGAYAAGIGGGSNSTGGTVSITGGTVSAFGGDNGPGIGAAYHGSLVAVSITGGSVTATGGDSGNGIGSGLVTGGVPVTIGAGASVTASGGPGYSAVGGAPGYAFGSLSVGGTLTIPSTGALIVPTGATAIVQAGGSLVNNGTIDLTGTLAGDTANHGRILVRTGGVVDPATVSDHNYVITFDPANGSQTSQTRVYAASFTDGELAAPTTPTRSGYTFAGWFTAAAGGTEWTVDSTLASDATITAQWDRILAPFVSPAAATVSGIAGVGSTLTVDVTTAASPTPDSYTYQWLADGDAIAGATGATYVPTADVFGARISVVVTPVLDGYDGATGAATSPDTAAVTAASFTHAPTVAIMGTPTSGGSLTAVIGDPAQPTPTGYAFQWYADGRPIDGATLTTLALTADLVGATITVEALPQLAGYAAASGSASSAATVPVAGLSFDGFIGLDVSGTVQVGRTLTASVRNGLFPMPTAFAYTWSADGIVVATGPGRTFSLDRMRAGAKLTVTVTASAPGYEPVSVTRAFTVAAAPALSLSAASVPAGTSVTVTGRQFLADPRVNLELHSDVVVVGVVEPAADGTFTSTFTVAADTPVGVHHVVAVDPDGRALATVELAVTAPAAAAASAGDALASTGSSSPVPAALTAVLFALAGLVLALRARRRSARA